MRLGRDLPGADSDAWARYARALDGRRLPAALVDLDAFEANVDRLLGFAGGKPLRIATKSVRCPSLIRRAAERGGDAVVGLMTYAAAESAFLAGSGRALVGDAARDLLLAYPTVQPADSAALCEANRVSRCAVVVDDAAQVEALGRAARESGVTLPLVVDLDLSYRPLGMLHLGVRRSPLRGARAIVELARTIEDTDGASFAGLQGYEAQIAGLPDASPGRGLSNRARRAFKRISRTDVERARAEAVAALAAAGLPPALVNGGGTGSVAWASAEPALTEVTVGSGFLAGHLFDRYHQLGLAPAACFALQVVRRPAPGVVTCHGGGYVASGESGADRLPRPFLPAGCRLIVREGAGEVQTPVRLPRGVDVAPGQPIFFRHAKSGELAEHFDHYLLVRGDRVVEVAPTYRGLGQNFLG